MTCLDYFKNIQRRRRIQRYQQPFVQYQEIVLTILVNHSTETTIASCYGEVYEQLGKPGIRSTWKQISKRRKSGKKTPGIPEGPKGRMDKRERDVKLDVPRRSAFWADISPTSLLVSRSVSTNMCVAYQSGKHLRLRSCQFSRRAI